MKHIRKRCFVIIPLVVVFVLGNRYIKNIQKELINREQEILLDQCYVYEKYGEAELNDEIHYEEDNTVIYKNGELRFAEISSYKHIHCMIKGDDGMYFSAVISDEDKKYLLKLDEEFNVTEQMEIDTLPAKLFVFEDSLAAYYIDQGKANLYKVGFENKRLDLLIDDISVSGSNTGKLIGSVYDDAADYLDMYDEYERYEKYGKDILFVMFDKGCFEDIHITDDRIVYKSTSSGESGWNVICEGKVSAFNNGDRCFGFTDDENLLFYKSVPTGFFQAGLFYKYNIETGKKHSYRIVLSDTVGSTAISDDGESVLLVTPGNEMGWDFHLMDTGTTVYKYVGWYDAGRLGGFS